MDAGRLFGGLVGQGDAIVYQINRQAVGEGDYSDFLRRFGPDNLARRDDPGLHDEQDSPVPGGL